MTEVFFEDVGVLCVSILPVPELMELQGSVDQVALMNGVLPAQYPYTPHISIARFSEALIEHRSPKTILHQVALHLGQFCQRPQSIPFDRRRCHFHFCRRAL